MCHLGSHLSSQISMNPPKGRPLILSQWKRFNQLSLILLSNVSMKFKKVNTSLSCVFHDYLQRSRFVLYPDHELMSSQRVPPSGLRPRHDLVIIIFLNNVVVSTGRYLVIIFLNNDVASIDLYFGNYLSQLCCGFNRPILCS